MSGDFDVVVVGGGIVGSAVFARLAASGKRVVLLERSRFGQGSSGWSGGILRCYHPSQTLSEMASAGLPDFQAVEDKGGATFHRCGFLYFVYPGQEETARQRIAQLLPRTAIEWLDAERARERFPSIRWTGLAGAVFEPDAGHMDPVAVSRHWVREARILGQQALEGVAFTGVVSDEHGLNGVHTTLGLLRTRHLVLCPGAWSANLARISGLSLPKSVVAKAIQLNTFATTKSVDGHPAYIDPKLGLYGRGEGKNLVHAGCPVPEWGIDPDRDVPLSLPYLTSSLELARRRFEWAEGATGSGGWRRFDAYTQDEHGVVATCSRTPGVHWATGFSGGGFKLAPAVARQVETLISSTI